MATRYSTHASSLGEKEGTVGVQQRGGHSKQFCVHMSYSLHVCMHVSSMCICMCLACMCVCVCMCLACVQYACVCVLDNSQSELVKASMLASHGSVIMCTPFECST